MQFYSMWSSVTSLYSLIFIAISIQLLSSKEILIIAHLISIFAWKENVWKFSHPVQIGFHIVYFTYLQPNWFHILVLFGASCPNGDRRTGTIEPEYSENVLSHHKTKVFAWPNPRNNLLTLKIKSTLPKMMTYSDKLKL